MSFRITFVLPHLSLSGGDKVTITYAEGLARRGHKVTLVHGRFPSSKGRLYQYLTGRDAKFHRPGPEVDLVPAKGLPADLPAFLPDSDVLIASWWETVESISAAPPSKGTLIHHVQGHEVFPYLPARSASVYRLNVPKIAVSNWLVEILLNTYGSKDVSLVMNPVDVDRFGWVGRSRLPLPTVGTLFSVTPVKNSAMALAAVRLARQSLPELRLTCFGTDQPPAEWLREPFVSFQLTPRQDVIPGLYRSADFWLFTSTSEGFGLPILEAMAVGTPVIGTRAGAAPDLINVNNGALVEHEPEAMANAIVRLFAKPESSWQKLSRSSRRVAQAHNVDRAVSDFEAVLHAHCR